MSDADFHADSSAPAGVARALPASATGGAPRTAPQHASRQRRAFRTVLAVELCERFGFYGMAPLLLLFMVQYLGFGDRQATLTWGAAAALIYAAPAVGGWLGDRVLGTRRTMTFGALVLMAGYFLLAVPSDEPWLLYAALGVVVVGNGFFKANASNLVRRIYEGEDSRLDSAFTLYYMSINVGSTLAILVTPWVRQHWGWRSAFAVCGVGLVLALANYLLMRRTLAGIGSAADEREPGARVLGLVLLGALCGVAAVVLILGNPALALACVYLAGLAALGIVVWMIFVLAGTERAGMLAVAVLLVQTALFFIFYQQMFTSLTLFALRHVDWRFALFGVHLFDWDPAQYQGLNPAWIMLLSPLLAAIYLRLARAGGDPSIAVKYIGGFLAVAAGFFVCWSSGAFAVDGRVSSWTLVWGYGLIALGELLVSGLGLAMIARYTPTRIGGLMMGVYLVTTGVAQYAGSVIANLANVGREIEAADRVAGLAGYTSLFGVLGCVALAGAAFGLLMLPLMRRLSSAHAGVPAMQPAAQPG